MTPVVPRTRRPDQNTGRKARVALEVESQECAGGGLHVLVKSDEGVACSGCGVSWADLDGELNQRGESWLG